MFPPTVPGVDVGAVDPKSPLLDVREPEEWVAGHIDGALHIPLADVPARLDELPPDTQITVVCRSGQRSSRVVTWLLRNGVDAVNLTGGMQAWEASGREMVSETGAAAVVR